MPKLVLLFEGRVLKETAVSHTAAVTVGRLPDNTIVIDNSAVSSRHIRIAREGPQFVVEDLESTNGTFVNGDKITKRALRHGDTILVGKHKIFFDRMGDAEFEGADMPLLTGAGIVGLAVGFGAQTLVKDIISGLFLIAEDQVRIGDVVDINGIGGAVEDINLRTIVLRDVEGTVHTISNGDIRTLANRSKDFAFYVIDLAVGYDDDTDRIIEVVNAVARELMEDTKFAASILAPLEVVGVDAFKPTEVTLRFRIKTLPLKQWEVGRELRRRIKKAFDANNIRIPTPQLSVRLKSDQKGSDP